MLYKYSNANLHGVSRIPSILQQKESKKPNICTYIYNCFKYCFCSVYGCYIYCIKGCFKLYFKYILPIYYVDSKLRIFSIIVREWIEILIQMYALFLYGGISLLFPSSNVLSQEPQIIQSFTIIVSANCILGMYLKYTLLSHFVSHINNKTKVVRLMVFVSKI